MKTITLTAAMLTAGLVSGLAGCQSAETADRGSETEMRLASGPVNKVCPIGGHDANPEIGTVSYKGHEIAFCCEGCLDAWADADTETRDEILQTALSE